MEDTGTRLTTDYSHHSRCLYILHSNLFDGLPLQFFDVLNSNSFYSYTPFHDHNHHPHLPCGITISNILLLGLSPWEERDFSPTHLLFHLQTLPFPLSPFPSPLIAFFLS